MSIGETSETGTGNSFTATSLVDMAGTMDEWIRMAAAQQWAFHEFKSEWHEMIHRMANLGTGLFISQQGDGDLGDTVNYGRRRDAATQCRTGESSVSNGLRTVSDSSVRLRSRAEEEERTPADIVAALFRDAKDSADRPPRPIPVTKQLTARFARERDLGKSPEMISGQIEAFSWASQRIRDRLQPEQPLIALMDGSPSQWDAAHVCLDPDVSARAVEMLDILHVSQYVWKAAKAFHSHREHQEAPSA